MIGKAAKSKIVAFVSAIGFMMVGSAATTPANAGETEQPIKFETEPPGESVMIEEIAKLTRELQDKRKVLQGSEIFRGVHPKSHGCVDATFTVLKYIDSDYQVGLFAQHATYAAKIRYSNASVLKLADLKGGNGSRGMAIKVLGVGGFTMLPYTDDGSQDFLMINTPEFAFANVRDYLRLSRVLMAHPVGADPTRYFVPAQLFDFGVMTISGTLNPPEPGESQLVTGMRQVLLTEAFKKFSQADMIGTLTSAQVVQKIASQTVRNPLEIQYFSGAPFRFGPDRVMRFSVVPAAGEIEQKAFKPEEIGALNDDYLALELKKSMAQSKARGKKIYLSFMVQTAEQSELAGREQDMIENAALSWNENEFPFVKVAQIVIDPNNQDKEEFVDACRDERFTPWHGLAAHEPLGGINRLRKPVYCESGKFRPDGGDPTQVLCRAAEYN